MNKPTKRVMVRIGGPLLAVTFLSGCAGTGLTSYAGREVLAPTQKMIEEAKTKADHEALAAYYQREAQALHEKAKYYQEMADQGRWRGGIYRIFYVPRYEALAQEYKAAQEENLKQAKRHRELAAEAGQ